MYAKRKTPATKEWLLKDLFGSARRFQLLGQIANRAVECPEEEFTRNDIVKNMESGDRRLATHEIAPTLNDLAKYGLLSVACRDDVSRQYIYSIIEGEAQECFWNAIRVLDETTVRLTLPKES